MDVFLILLLFKQDYDLIISIAVLYHFTNEVIIAFSKKKSLLTVDYY